MKISDMNRKYVFLGFVGFIILGLIAGKIMGNSQKEEQAELEAMYNYAIETFSAGSTEEALNLLKVVYEDQPNSEVVNYALAILSNNVEQNDVAAKHMQKALDINPHNVESPDFLFYFGQMLFGNEQYDEAKIVFEYIQQHGMTTADIPDYDAYVQEYLSVLASLDDVEAAGELLEEETTEETEQTVEESTETE